MEDMEEMDAPQTHHNTDINIASVWDILPGSSTMLELLDHI